MTKPKCEDCYYAAPSTFPDKDGKKWYSCRYTPPMPYADEKQSMYKDWRIVPEDFWCGKYHSWRLVENQANILRERYGRSHSVRYGSDS